MTRTIICGDALPWLAAECPPCAIVTSPPDQAELGCEMDEWEAWYRAAHRAMFAAIAPKAPAIIYATDRKAGGEWHSKAALIIAVAAEAGLRVLWHKIVIRRAVGGVDVRRPGYSHLIAVGGPKCGPGTATADVIERGDKLYPNAIGFVPAHMAITFSSRAAHTIVDPFCGRGTIPAMADAMGLDSIGVDIDPAQCRAAKALRLRLK